MKNPQRKYGIVNGFFWLCWIILHIFILTDAEISFNSAFKDALVSNVLLFLLSLVLNNILRFYQPGPKSAWYLALWCFVMVLIWYGLQGFLIPLILSGDFEFMILYEDGLLLRFVLAFLLIGMSAMTMWMNQLFINRKEDSIRRFEEIQMAKEAELNNLRQQLQPHFLFNTLNSISALSVSQPEKARNMIQQLSDFLRGTLKKDNDGLIGFKEEIDHIKLYLDIEMIRFGHRLKAEITVSHDAENFMLPPLLMLPLVENAIKYGLYDTLGEVLLTMDAQVIDSMLIISVTNPFDPDSANRNKGVGFGLDTLSRRLYLIFGRNDLLETRQSGNIFTSILKIPFKTS